MKTNIKPFLHSLPSSSIKDNYGILKINGLKKKVLRNYFRFQFIYE